MEARVIFQNTGEEETNLRGEAGGPTVNIQKKVSSQACDRSSPRQMQKSTSQSWLHSSCDSSRGLVYVMDNPTGGVWVKPEENWTRS